MDDSSLADTDAVRSRRHPVVVRVGAALLTLSVAAASILAWQLVSARPAHARSGAAPNAASGDGHGAKRPGRSRTTPTTTPTTAPTVITTRGPLRVVEIGDSLGVDLGEALESTWPSPGVKLTMAARGDTGLANSGYYDWPTALAGLLASAHPQVVIVFLGANDLQSMVSESKILYDGTSAWNAGYAARVTAVISESVRAGSHVLWIGEPAMQTAFINAGMARIDGIAKRVVARYHGEAAYLNSNSILAPDGTFSFDVTGPMGQEVQVRTPDGVHLMAAGADLLAAATAEALVSHWGMHVAGQ